MYTTYNYTPNRIIMVNLRQHQFSGGRCVPLSWREIGKSIFRLKPTFLAHCIYPRDSFKVLPGVFCARIAEALEEVERHLLSLKLGHDSLVYFVKRSSISQRIQPWHDNTHPHPFSLRLIMPLSTESTFSHEEHRVYR